MAGPLHNPDSLIADGWGSHSDFTRLLDRMQRLRSAVSRWSGLAYRFVEPRFARDGDRLSGVGAQQFGERWNPAGLATVYGSRSPEGATEEVFGNVQTYGLRVEQLTPRVFFAFRAELRRVLDLTDGEVRRRLQVSEQRMIACDWRASRVEPHQEQLTQAIGRAAAAAGFHGLFVPSAVSDVSNLVVFLPELLPESCSLRTINAEDLIA